MALLEGPSAKQLEMIKLELGEGSGDVENGVRDLRNMCATSSYLPQPENIDTHLLELFVRGCRMDRERARTKFEAFCLSRARYRDLYVHRSLNEPPLNSICDFIDVVPLPKLTDEGLRVTIFRIKPEYPESSADVSATVRAVLLIADTRMHDETYLAGDVFVWELSQVRGSLTTRIAAAASAIRRAIHLAHTAYPQRLKRIHVVNAPPFIASSMQLMRSCVNEKIKRRIYIHQKTEDLLEHIPARVLPVECGGEEQSLDILAKKWRRRIDEVRDYLRDLNEICHTATGDLPENEIYGAIGAFRKLDID